MQQFIEANGGKVNMKSKLKEIVVDEEGAVRHLEMADGSLVVADEYAPPPSSSCARVCMGV